ncbi:N/A [soil metagenome]
MTALLIVSLDEISIALPATQVTEVVRAVAITPVPGCPEVVEGVVNVRGEPLPAYDLRGRFRLAPRAVHRDDHLVIVNVGARGSAIVRVNRAHELRDIDPELIAAATSSTDPVIRGLARLPDGLLVVCDLAAFLTDLEAERTARAIATRQETT